GRARGAVVRAAAGFVVGPVGPLPAVPEPHPGQLLLGRPQPHRPDALRPRPRRADPAAGGRVDLRAERLRPAVRHRRVRAGRDGDADEPRAERQRAAAVPLPPAGGAADADTTKVSGETPSPAVLRPATPLASLLPPQGGGEVKTPRRRQAL